MASTTQDDIIKIIDANNEGNAALDFYNSLVFETEQIQDEDYKLIWSESVS